MSPEDVVSWAWRVAVGLASAGGLVGLAGLLMALLRKDGATSALAKVAEASEGERVTREELTKAIQAEAKARKEAIRNEARVRQREIALLGVLYQRVRDGEATPEDIEDLDAGTASWLEDSEKWLEEQGL